MNKKTLQLLGLVFLVLALTDQAHAIIGGVAPDSPAAHVDANSKSSPFAGVGSISINGGKYSGVLISDQYVLTAAHVVNGVDPTKIQFNLNYGGALTEKFGTAEVHVNPRYTGALVSPGGIAHDDLAIIKLNGHVPEDVPVYPISGVPLARGDVITFVGYGSGGSGDVGITVGANPAVKRVAENRVDMLYGDVDGWTRQAVAYEFDFDGARASSNVFGSNIPRNFTLGNMIEGMLAGGDSGSPSFVQDSQSKWTLVGINTFIRTMGGGGPVFGSTGGGMLMSAYSPWVESIVSPVPEPQTGFLWLSGLSVIAFAVARRAD
ncbi:MAG: trypsin-like serine protease [Sulfuriferula sp.]